MESEQAAVVAFLLTRGYKKMIDCNVVGDAILESRSTVTSMIELCIICTCKFCVCLIWFWSLGFQVVYKFGPLVYGLKRVKKPWSKKSINSPD